MKTLLPIGLIVTLMLVLAVPPRLSWAALATGTASGSVIDSDGKIVTNIKVRFKKVVARGPIGNDADSKKPDSLTAATTTTDKEGKFSQSLDPGNYFAEAGNKTQGYARERFEIKAGETTDIKLTLSKDDLPKEKQ
jgi:hypothetical protein